ncbi:MAG: hypothetical protein D6744_03100, partial [Planctomycetota bacterium]
MPFVLSRPATRRARIVPTGEAADERERMLASRGSPRVKRSAPPAAIVAPRGRTYTSACMDVNRRNSLIVLLMAALACLSAAPAAAQEEYYRERQVFDPETGEWVDQPEPSAPVETGVLADARLLLVQGEPRAARKLLEKWIEENPD